MAVTEIDFEETSKAIVKVLKQSSKDMSESERIRYIYNEAMDDAINWVIAMGEKNPDIRLACMRLEDSMKEWLLLR